MRRPPWIGGSARTTHYGRAALGALVSFQIGCGSGASFPTFVAEPAVPVPTHPNALVVGDFDRDGDPDVIVFGLVSNDYQVFENVHGRLVARDRVPLDGGPLQAQAADFDEDGTLDLAISLPSSRRVAILHGRGDLTFSEISSVPLDAPNELVAGALDADPHLDLAVTRFDPGGLWLLHGDGRGGFNPDPVIDAPAGAGSLAPAAHPSALATSAVARARRDVLRTAGSPSCRTSASSRAAPRASRPRRPGR